MATAGYYIRGSTRDSVDWALIRTDDQYRDEVLVDGLSYRKATALYWKRMEELRAGRAAEHSPETAGQVAADSRPRRASRQLAIKF